MKKIISKTYGESDYKGFILLKNHTNNKITKHYISAVDPQVSTKSNIVSLFYRDKSGDSVIDYKMGSNKKVDIGVKTWVKERKKRKKRVSPNLPKSCYSFLFSKKTKRQRYKF